MISITKSFCSEICCLSKNFIKFPRTQSRTGKAIATFIETTYCKIPQAVGAIDSIHITILSPHSYNNFNSKIDYYNRKQEYSINSQAVSGLKSVIFGFLHWFSRKCS